MAEILTSGFWEQYGSLLLEGTRDTLIMTVVSTVFAYILGLPLGVLLSVTQPHGILPNRAVNRVLGWIINVGRSLPFIILMVAIMDFTKLLVGTKIGIRGAIVPLVISAAPFIARMVETSLAEVDAGVVEAAQAMGASPLQIIWKVYLPEAKPSLLLGGSISIITILAYTAIAGAVSVLLSSGEVSEKNRPMLEGIKNDADGMIVMVENLLSVTRIQDGSYPLKKRDEMLEEVAGDAILTTRRRFPDYKVELDMSEDILYLPMEPMLIKQVIVNLLENAIRHSGDRDHIRLHLFRQDDWAVVEVRDRGKGLSPEICQAVQAGRPLDQSLSNDSTRGMGIGLSACQSIIKAHGGFFAAGNDPEGGAVLRFGLPMEETSYE